MVIEIAQFRAQPGKADELAHGLLRGLTVIQGAEGCQAARMCRCVEDGERFIYEIEWASLEAHVRDFRGGPLFQEYRSHINGLYVEPIEVRHYEVVRE